MRVVVCLHAAAAVPGPRALHATDRHAVAMARALVDAGPGGELVVLEAVAATGTTPAAASEALAAGADRAVRVVATALATADAQTVGFVTAAVIDRLQADLVLFGDGADPEGVGDVCGAIAHHMGALYLVGVDSLGAVLTTPVATFTPESASAPTPAARGADEASSDADGIPSPVPSVGAVEAVVRGCGWRRRLRLPLDAVLGIAPPTPATPESRGAPLVRTGVAVGAARPVVVLTLADLGIEEALVRRRDDRRGVIEPSVRPLVTLESAAALTALVGRGD